LTTCEVTGRRSNVAPTVALRDGRRLRRAHRRQDGIEDRTFDEFHVGTGEIAGRAGGQVAERGDDAVLRRRGVGTGSRR
jgi:hypothetical protein